MRASRSTNPARSSNTSRTSGPGEPRLFSAELRQRALQRRMVREADQYFAAPMERLVEAVLFTPPERWSEERIAAARADAHRELAIWETAVAGEYLAGALSAADFTLYPYVALVLRMGKRKPGLRSEERRVGKEGSGWWTAG